MAVMGGFNNAKVKYHPRVKDCLPPGGLLTLTDVFYPVGPMLFWLYAYWPIFFYEPFCFFWYSFEFELSFLL